MKPTITIEIEGTKSEIDSIASKISKFAEGQTKRVNVRQGFGFEPGFGFKSKQRHW